MQAVILAAGRGSRLSSVIQDRPKALIPLGNTSLIQYQIATLRRFGIENICLILGYRADDVKRVVGDNFHFIINERYAETNSLYSLSLAQDWVRGAFVLSNCDVLAHPSIYRRLLATPGNVLAYDSASGGDEEEMKVIFKRGKLRQISKALCPTQAQGESIGLLKFEAWSVDTYFREVQAALAVGGENQWSPVALQRLVSKRPMGGVDIIGLPWVEIDFPEDYVAARQCIWPQIRAGSRAMAAPFLYQMSTHNKLAYGAMT